MQREFARGSIWLWAGSIASIPPTFRLCDGTRLTPDLRDRFIVGSGTTYNPGDTGGVINHLHNFDADLHFHTIGVGAGFMGGTSFAQDVTNVAVGGDTENGSATPPFYSLAYIMYDGRLL